MEGRPYNFLDASSISSAKCAIQSLLEKAASGHCCEPIVDGKSNLLVMCGAEHLPADGDIFIASQRKCGHDHKPAVMLASGRSPMLAEHVSSKTVWLNALAGNR